MGKGSYVQGTEKERKERKNFTCGKVDVGQSGRCVNTRLRECASSLKSTPAGHLAVVRDCNANRYYSDKGPSKVP
ncbi:unnamed protein product [Ixodes pacificus]